MRLLFGLRVIILSILTAATLPSLSSVVSVNDSVTIVSYRKMNVARLHSEHNNIIIVYWNLIRFLCLCNFKERVKESKHYRTFSLVLRYPLKKTMFCRPLLNFNIGKSEQHSQLPQKSVSSVILK